MISLKYLLKGTFFVKEKRCQTNILDTRGLLPYTENHRVVITVRETRRLPPMKDAHRKNSKPRQRGYPLLIATALDVLRDAVENFRRNGDTNQAAAIAFYAILSIIPLYILTLLAAGLIFGGSQAETQERLIRLIQEFHPYFRKSSSPSLVRRKRYHKKVRSSAGWGSSLSSGSRQWSSTPLRRLWTSSSAPRKAGITFFPNCWPYR